MELFKIYYQPLKYEVYIMQTNKSNKTFHEHQNLCANDADDKFGFCLMFLQFIFYFITCKEKNIYFNDIDISYAIYPEYFGLLHHVDVSYYELKICAFFSKNDL